MRSLLPLFLLLLTPLAQAYCPIEREGWYITGSGAYDWFTTNQTSLTSSISNVNISEQSTTSKDFRNDDTWSVAGAIGLSEGNYRLELEGRYRNDKQEGPLTTSQTFPDNADTYTLNSETRCFGQVSQFTLMGNLYCDIRLMSYFDFYVGAGAGVGMFNTSFRADVAVSGGATDTAVIKVNEHERRFVYQVMAGISKDLNCTFTVYAGWRLMGSTAPEDQEGTAILVGTETTTNYVKVASENIPINQSVEAGIRINF